MIDSLKKYMRVGAIAGILMTALASCSEDSMIGQEPSSESGLTGGITFLCSDMLETYVGDHNTAGTRAAASKNPEEKAIKTLHVFFFDYLTGDLINTEEYANFRSYRKEVNTSFIKVPTSSEEFKNGDEGFAKFQDKFKSVHIVAIANIDAIDDATSATDASNAFFTDYSPEGKILREGRTPEADVENGKEHNYEGGQPLKITNYEDLKKWVYYPRIRMNEDGTGDITKLPESGMPMIGELGNKAWGEKALDLSTKPASTPIVNMIALMAKVNVSVELDPDQIDKEKGYPILHITGYGVRNMPIAVPFEQPDGSVIDGIGGKPTGGSEDEIYANYFKKYNVTNVAMFHKGDSPVGSTHFACEDEAHEFLTPANITINKDSEAATFSYYTFENINLPNYNATRASGDDAFNSNLEPQYPDAIKKLEETNKAEADAMKQRWKSTFAYSDRASALILKGEYTTHQGLTYKAQFTVYMGSNIAGQDTDPNIDFMVKRNHQYDNNIVINGLDYIRNSDDEVYNFDGRVNIVDDNPLYLAIVNERKVDAHASALPMDVWFMLRENGDGSIVDNPDWTSEVTFKIRDYNNKKGNWLRMEKVTRAKMEEGRVINGKKVPFAFGTGARDYFTSDLVTNTLKNNYEITVDANRDGSRSRIYFYIDENVPTNNNPSSNPNASDYYGDRMAIIDIHYVRKDADGRVVDTRDRTLEIEQRALLKVDGSWKGNGGEEINFDDNNNQYVTWMEYYEEYLDHSDPLDKHESPGELYNGLPWGLEGYNVYNQGHWEGWSYIDEGFKNPEKPNLNIYRDYYWKVYYKTGAFEMTKWVFSRNDIPSLNTVKLYNDKHPESAFHYCYGKNKRKADGAADVSGNKGWYIPGIRELERALVMYYNTFPVLRGNLYWSASAADEGNGDPGNYARATSVNLSNGKITYTNSTKNTDNGYCLRGKSYRIRAFYRVN